MVRGPLKNKELRYCIIIYSLQRNKKKSIERVLVDAVSEKRKNFGELF
jgi:hypothetical protein